MIRSPAKAPRKRQEGFARLRKLRANGGKVSHACEWSAQTAGRLRTPAKAPRKRQEGFARLRKVRANGGKASQVNIGYEAEIRRYFRRAGTTDALSGCDRRTSRSYARGEAREGYARVSFLGAPAGLML